MYARIALLLVVLCSQHVTVTYSDSHFTNTWAVEIKGGPEKAEQVARDHGYEIVRQVSKLQDKTLRKLANAINICFLEL